MSRSNAWYISSAKGAEGPFATDLMRAMIREQRLKPLDLVFREGDDEWRPVSMFTELRPETADLEMAKAMEAVERLPDFSPSKAASTTSDGTEAGSAGVHEWIVLRPHGSTYLQEGPFRTEQVREGLKTGAFNFGQYAWHVGMPQWMRIGDLREFDRRSTPRESTPHVPPPLPDPITAVLLEDDGDFESEEFHVSVNSNLRADLTPVDLFNLGKDAFNIGGAAAKSPELIGRSAEARDLAADLAKVPWEERLESSVGFSRNVELLDDESSYAGFESTAGSINDSMNRPSPSATRPAVEAGIPSAPYVAVSQPPEKKVDVADSWNSWGRYVGAAGFAFVAGSFILHLVTKTEVRLERSVVQARPLIDKLQEKSSDDLTEAKDAGVVSSDAVMARNQSVTPSAPIAVPPIADLEIVGLKLDGPEAALIFQGAVPVAQPITVTFRGRLGEVLGSLNVRKTVSVVRRGGEIPSLALKDLGLPQGSYTVEVATVDGRITKTDLFIGKRDARFIDQLEAHLRDNAFELQNQKKVLFYASQELDVLARDLGLNYGQLRSRAELWAKFYEKWTAKVSAVEKSIAELNSREASQIAYPEEAERLVSLVKALKETAAQFQNGVGASRDVASDGLTDLIAELSRQKALIGSISVRPAGLAPGDENPSGTNPSSEGTTSRGL